MLTKVAKPKDAYTASAVSSAPARDLSVEAYREFIKAKASVSQDYGFAIDRGEVNPLCKPHQVDAICWAVRGGRRALFESFGLGKSVQQIEILRLVIKHAGGRGLIVAPLGVRQEFKRDARKLGLEITFVRSMDDVRQRELFDGERSNIYLANYETVRDGKLDPSHFTVTSLDEAACFPACTLVDTPDGQRPIEHIKVGDRIFNAGGVDYVRAIHRPEIKRAVRIRVAGRDIVSSDNHKYFTERGWIPAAELQPGDSIMETVSAMRLVRRSNYSAHTTRSQEAFLQSVLLGEMAEFTTGDRRANAGNQIGQSDQPYQSAGRLETASRLRVVQENISPEIRLGAKAPFLQSEMFDQMADVAAVTEGDYIQGSAYARNQKEKRREKEGVVGIRLTESQSAKTETGGSRQEPKRREYSQNGRLSSGQNLSREGRQQQTDSPTNAPGDRSWQSADGIRYRNNIRQASVSIAPQLLQSGYCLPGKEDRNRSGWQNPQAEEVEVSRQEENSRPQFARVDSVEILELGHPDLARFRNADGKLYFYDLSATRHPSFSVNGLLVHNCLRSFGGTKTFREFMRLFEAVPYRFVATATPDPNEYIELIAYAAYLGISDVSGAKTRFFKRDSTKADKLTIHPHKEEEFWLWVASWALFLNKPSDLSHSDDGYDLPPLDVVYHEIPAERAGGSFERDGQQRMFRDALVGVVDAAREKRETLDRRIAKTREILAAEPDEHFILWHDLEAERAAIEKAVPAAVSVYGKQPLDERERAIINFSDGKIQYLASKPVMLGAGCNFQYHCSRAIFVGIGFKFAEWIQAVHRIHRFLQGKLVRIHLIYAESERGVLENLKRKWEQHNRKVEKMAEIIREFGLSQQAMIQAMQRSMGVERVEVAGDNYRLINNDCVEEAATMAEDSVGLILTSIPFSTQYEYTPSMNDFGHTESNRHFFEQMDFLTPHLFRALQPGRIAAIHVKDRIVPGGMTGLGFQTVYPFHMDCIAHYTKHGFAYMGMKTIVTDVVRENNQTYRLGWTEQCKDGTKMGVGMPEYLLIFRKPPTDTTNSYADLPVVKSKGGVFFACPECGFKTLDEKQFRPASDATSDKKCPSCKAQITVNIHRVNGYSRSRWQIDAHGFARSNGNRPPRPEELEMLQHQQIFKIFRDYSLNQVYDFEYHVRIGEALERKQRLPVTFMLLQPASWHPDVWTDITRMRTLNGAQSARGKQMHLCPMQLDLAERAITQWSMEGETVMDPFGGLMTVPMTAVKLGRKGIGIELNPNYFADGCLYVEAAARDVGMPTLFDIAEEEIAAEAAA